MVLFVFALQTVSWKCCELCKMTDDFLPCANNAGLSVQLRARSKVQNPNLPDITNIEPSEVNHNIIITIFPRAFVLRVELGTKHWRIKTGISSLNLLWRCLLFTGCWFESQDILFPVSLPAGTDLHRSLTLTRHLPTDKHHSRENVRVCQTQIPMVTSSSSGAPDRSPGLVS